MRQGERFKQGSLIHGYGFYVSLFRLAVGDLCFYVEPRYCITDNDFPSSAVADAMASPYAAIHDNNKLPEPDNGPFMVIYSDFYSNTTKRSFAAPLTFTHTPSTVFSKVHSHSSLGYVDSTFLIGANLLLMMIE